MSYNVFHGSYYRRLLRREPWKIPRKFFRDVKHCGQRITKGYCGMDVGDMDVWFEYVIPDMLQEVKDATYDASLDEEYDGRKWRDILDEMIFLFREMNEDTCSKQNPLEEEWHRRYKEFEKQYGKSGEKLQTEEEKKAPGFRPHFPWELPENETFYSRYRQEEEKLEAYREDCKDKAFALFSKYFHWLWA